MADRVPVAVVGTGSIGMRHLNVLSGVVTVQPVAIPKRSERVFVLQDSGYMAVHSVEEARKLGTRLCVIASDTAEHLRDGVTAMEHGMDVLVEKPLSTDVGEAKCLMEAATKLGRNVFVGCVLRFSKSLNRFREMLGEIGMIHAVRIECQSYLPDWRPSRPYKESYSGRSAEGGVLRDLIHEIDYAGWIFGWPTALQARVKNLGRLAIMSDETADLFWEVYGGGVVSIRLDYLSKPTRRRMAAYGEQGTLEWDGVANTVSIQRDGLMKQQQLSHVCDEIFVEQMDSFLASCEGSWDTRLATGADGVKALAVCDAAWRATQSNREERVMYK
ncbi:MAG: hypothetical protein CMH81_00850 [Nitrospiraceae bacterium]|nr:hypothetical protein [Nitrospiraceae bacterium]